MPLRCFFSTLNARRIWPSSSIRCQNGPLWDSKLSRLQVRQPLNSPSVSTCRSGAVEECGFGQVVQAIWPSIEIFWPLNPILARCANPGNAFCRPMLSTAGNCAIKGLFGPSRFRRLASVARMSLALMLATLASERSIARPHGVDLLDAREWLDARSVVGNTDCGLPVGTAVEGKAQYRGRGSEFPFPPAGDDRG
jgi:hypothetical protein